MIDFKEEINMERNEIEVVEENIKEDKKMANKVKKIFDRVWSTAMIILNTAFGIFLTAAAFAAVGDDYFCKYHWQGILVGIVAMVAVNISNWWIRKMFKNY